MMGKLTKRHVRALSYLSSQLTWTPQFSIPDGNGHTTRGGASNETMRELRTEGLVEYGKNPNQSYYGYRITPAGREALSKAKDPQP